MGVVPLWSACPLKTTLKRLGAAMAVTTPIFFFFDSSTGPCSM